MNTITTACFDMNRAGLMSVFTIMLARAPKSHRGSRAKVKPILQEQAQQLRALRDDPSLSPEQKSAKKKIVHELIHDQINSLLTPEQQDKFKQMKQDGMEKQKK